MISSDMPPSAPPSEFAPVRIRNILGIVVPAGCREKDWRSSA